MAKVLLVCGYGPGISEAVARKFGSEGFVVALVGRTRSRVDQAAQSLGDAKITAKGFQCDVGDPEAVKTLVAEVQASLGPISVLHWNAYSGKAGDLTTAPTAELRDVFDVAVHGLLGALQAALPDLKKGGGALLVTGGGLSSYADAANQAAVGWGAMGLALAEAAQHKLVGLLNQKLAPDGVYVGEVTVLALVKGTIFDSGAATLEPATVAAKFWEMFQSRSAVYTEVS
ncbi:MAG TPA: SDR family NAD(P)-dependent oxidoreductase [Polyangiaceae bacterium]|nr:SDR family NAD(P)-dependent oxidoreductase [Polyangiaceae bacterium]